MAHVAERHPLRNLGRGLVIAAFLAAVTGIGDDWLGMNVVGETSMLTTFKFSRDHEEVADELTLKTLHARYGHHGGADDIFLALTGGKSPQSTEPPEFFSTHPATTRRIRAARAKAPDDAASNLEPLPVSLSQRLQEAPCARLPSSRDKRAFPRDVLANQQLVSSQALQVSTNDQFISHADPPMQLDRFAANVAPQLCDPFSYRSYETRSTNQAEFFDLEPCENEQRIKADDTQLHVDQSMLQGLEISERCPKLLAGEQIVMRNIYQTVRNPEALCGQNEIMKQQCFVDNGIVSAVERDDIGGFKGNLRERQFTHLPAVKQRVHGRFYARAIFVDQDQYRRTVARSR